MGDRREDWKCAEVTGQEEVGGNWNGDEVGGEGR
jgi:hypothetical protein